MPLNKRKTNPDKNLTPVGAEKNDRPSNNRERKIKEN